MKAFAMFSKPIYTPKCFCLIGPPGSGKSTWRAANLLEGSTVISSDDIIDERAAAAGLTYGEIYPQIDMKEIKKLLRGKFDAAIANNQHIVLDRTNLTSKSRRSFLGSLPKRYTKIGVVFEVPQDVLFERIRLRGEATGKTIPLDVVEDMIKRYQPPMPGEFHQIEYIRV